ncbi:MAG: acetyl-CoA carboxylase carboxyltransferase subunit beta [Verrucomicrobia bacterium]|nr:MAG: acetyl-CoA carboxylase carboxyltransferase subunit beta [Verrucomicrobiota bacterium]
MATTILNKKSFGTDGTEPALTPPTMDPGGTSFAKKPKLSGTKKKKSDIPEGLWTKCPKCSTMIFDKELDENLKVCSKCQHHFTIGARERINSLVETCTFEEMDAQMISVDILAFTGTAAYKDKLASNWKKTNLKDAVITGICQIGPHRAALGVMDFSFLGGSMGSVVGEKLTRLIERGTEKNLPVIIISTSGGARMYEGMFSLMQMAKTCAALAYHARAKLPYISILTNPDYAGVMASYASVGDLILAEPQAMIGFAGPRVIKDTTNAELPPGFQTAEFLLDHGLIDAIVPRKEMKVRLIEYLDYLMVGKKAAAAA